MNAGVLPSEEMTASVRVRRAQDHIRAGDAFQIVLSQRAERRTDVSALALYRSLRQITPRLTTSSSSATLH